MIRKGCFDEVLFVDVPINDRRIEIFKIHFGYRRLDLAQVQSRTNEVHSLAKLGPRTSKEHEPRKCSAKPRRFQVYPMGWSSRFMQEVTPKVT